MPVRQLVRRVEHRGHAVAQDFRDAEHVRGLLARVAVVPAVQLEGAVAHGLAALAQLALHLAPDQRPLVGVAAEQVRSKREGLGHGGAGAAPLRDVRALDAVSRADHDRELRQLQRGVRPVAGVVDDLRVLRRAAEVPRRRGELNDLDLRDTAYDGLLQKPAALGSQRLRAGT
jgi:hypothetical protein